MIKQRLVQWALRHILLVQCFFVLCIIIEVIITAIFLLYHSIFFLVPLVFYTWLVWLGRGILYSMSRPTKRQ